jgi:glucosamine kinase
VTPFHLIGIDGGGTRTTVVVADAHGGELLRQRGPAGIVDPRDPEGSARALVERVRESLDRAAVRAPVAALCAGLAGVGDAGVRERVRRAIEQAGVAARVEVTGDSEIALEGAFHGGAGILLIAGTGSNAIGRGEDGRLARCGGWGMIVGDEGSGYAMGRAALTAALRGTDGRGAPTRLLPELLARLGLDDPHQIPSWAGRAAKSQIAALVPVVVRLAGEGDEPSLQVLRDAAREQALHAAALAERLAPWSGPPPLVFFGGVFDNPLFCELVARTLAAMLPTGFRLHEAQDDAVSGAVRRAALLAVRAGALRPPAAPRSCAPPTAPPPRAGAENPPRSRG